MTLSESGFAGELVESKSDPRSLAGRPTKLSEIFGQVITPQHIAKRMVSELLANRPKRPVTILDPCVGPSTFPQLMLALGLVNASDRITLVDIDEKMIAQSRAALKVNGSVELLRADYLEVEMDNQFDFAVLNPPFIRQEWIEKKNLYRKIFKQRYGFDIPGTSNLYVYFIAKVIRDLKPGGRFACIVYDSWQFTKYGRWLRQLLENEGQSIEVATVDRLPFHDRLIDATIVFGTKVITTSSVKATIEMPPSSTERFLALDGFAPVRDVYLTKRGLRLKQADFFMGNLKKEIVTGATPFLKKVRLVKGYAVHEDHPEIALLINHEKEREEIVTELERRLLVALSQPDKNVSVLTWYKERPRSWMHHKSAPYAPIVFNYYIRNRPRHIFNPDRAYSDNFYGLIPHQGLSPFASIATLNSSAVCFGILARARNQGNGLAKIQLFEYREVSVPNLLTCSRSDLRTFHDLGAELIKCPHLAEATILRIDEAIAAIFADSRLHPLTLRQLLSEVRQKARLKKGISAHCPG